MTAQDQTTLRTIILQTSRLDITPAGKLLADLGHGVTASTSASDALRALQTDGADLVVVDMDKADEIDGLIERLAEVEPALRPRVVAVLSDRAGASPAAAAAAMRATSHSGDMPRVRYFLKPLHMHGLLGLVKRLEREELATGSS